MFKKLHVYQQLIIFTLTLLSIASFPINFGNQILDICYFYITLLAKDRVSENRLPFNSEFINDYMFALIIFLINTSFQYFVRIF